MTSYTMYDRSASANAARNRKSTMVTPTGTTRPTPPPDHIDCYFEPKSELDNFANVLSDTKHKTKIKRYSIDMLSNIITLEIIPTKDTDTFVRSLHNYNFVIEQYNEKTKLSVEQLTEYTVTMEYSELDECTVSFLFNNITLDKIE